jgi:hypothetical protein
MSVNDWFGPKKYWQLTLPVAELAPIMASGQGATKNRFKLKPRKKDGKIVYFTVDFKGSALPAVWKKVRLFPRGNTLAPQPAPPLSAQPTAREALDAVAAVRKYLNDHGASTERLDGEIMVNGELAALTLVQIPHAVGGTEALLCVFITFDAVRLAASNPDGSGGGHSGHN